jgi:glycosyltransferase involved in cell wall biosynthesis
MIIAIDGYEANIENRVGIGRYAYELLKNIYSLPKNKDIQFRIYLPQEPRDDMPKETSWWTYRVAKPKKLWTFIGLPFAILTDSPQADVVFSPTHYIPRFISIPRVMSIMDMSFLEYPELFRARDLHKLVRWTRYSAKHAVKIFTISDASKNDIIRRYGSKADNVVVTYPGLSMKNNQKTDNSLQKKFGIEKHYILSVGTLQPRKNYVRLIEAFSIFLKKNKQKFGKIQLVIAGKKGWMYEEIAAAPVKFGIGDSVKFIDFVDDMFLPSLYKNALCFALPSLYEGFGLPVAEAMMQGCPVVVSDVSSLPEIAGKAGIYVDPNSSESIAQGLLTAVRQRNLMQGKYRVTKGLEKIKEFTWEKAAKQTLEVLEEVGNPTSPRLHGAGKNV